MNIEDMDVREILPQRDPFLFVDRLLSCTEDCAVTEFKVPAGCILSEEGRLGCPALIENMAQSCAALTGYVCKYILHLPVKIGYIGSVKKFEIFRQPVPGETLRTVVHRREEIFGIMLSDVEVTSGGELLARASVKTAKTDVDAVI